MFGLAYPLNRGHVNHTLPIHPTTNNISSPYQPGPCMDVITCRHLQARLCYGYFSIFFNPAGCGVWRGEQPVPGGLGHSGRDPALPRPPEDAGDQQPGD